MRPIFVTKNPKKRKINKHQRHLNHLMDLALARLSHRNRQQNPQVVIVLVQEDLQNPARRLQQIRRLASFIPSFSDSLG